VCDVPRLLLRLLPAVAALALAAGCDVLTDEPAPGSSDSPEPQVAAIAGGACQLLDFAVIEQALGVRFDVSAAAQQEATYTCVLQKTAGSLPDLLLIVTPTSADTPIFRNTLMPKDATLVTGLGKVAYHSVGNAFSGRGPIVEVSWLSGNNRLMTLRYTTIGGTTPAEATALAAKLVELAKKVDQTSV
jgi:hypothetical protein